MSDAISKAGARTLWKNARRAHADGPSDAVCAQLLAQPFFQQAKKVALYAARLGEVDLMPLWRARPDACYFPKVTSATTMEFRRLARAQDLQPGFAGILEPTAGEVASAWEAGDLVLVPGAAFDLFGGRVGSGAGFYDRFLAQHAAKPWGVCWESQILRGKLDQEPSDVRMGALCTERRILLIGA